jgi:hypothetical protein
MVIVWLGPEQPTDASGLLLIEDILSKIKLIPSSVELSHLRSHPENLYPFFEKLWQDENWDAMNRIAQRPWMNRVRIIQEYLCATDCTMRLGSLQMHAPDFFQVMWPLRIFMFKMATDTRQQPFAAGPYSNASVLAVLKDMYLGASPEKPTGLFDLLVPTLAFQATDPRDKVFALAGLVTDDKMTDIIDYSKTLPEVLLSVAKWR